MSSKWLLVPLCAISFAALCWCQDLAQWTDSYVKSLAPAKHFRGTIVAERNGQVLVRKCYGTAVEEWQVPNSAETKFEIASLSKQFTAAAILQLADASKLNVEDSVSKYYPDRPTSWQGMTIHHLLTHTSGLPENEWENFYKGKATPYTTEEQVKTFRDRPLGFPQLCGLGVTKRKTRHCHRESHYAIHLQLRKLEGRTIGGGISCG
jgi:CubicO group peptidase (beta-lactamase class C family)